MCNHGGSCDAEFNDDKPIDSYLENEGKNEQYLDALLNGKKTSLKQKMEMIGQIHIRLAVILMWASLGIFLLVHLKEKLREKWFPHFSNDVSFGDISIFLAIIGMMLAIYSVVFTKINFQAERAEILKRLSERRSFYFGLYLPLVFGTIALYPENSLYFVYLAILISLMVEATFLTIFLYVEEHHETEISEDRT